MYIAYYKTITYAKLEKSEICKILICNFFCNFAVWQGYESSRFT